MVGMVKLVITVAAAPRLTVVYSFCLVITFAKSSNHSFTAVSMSLGSIAWGESVPAEGFSPHNVSLGCGEHMVFKRKGSPFAGSPFQEVLFVAA